MAPGAKGASKAPPKDERKILPFTHLKKEDYDKMSNKEKREFEK